MEDDPAPAGVPFPFVDGGRGRRLHRKMPACPPFLRSALGLRVGYRDTREALVSKRGVNHRGSDPEFQSRAGCAAMPRWLARMLRNWHLRRAKQRGAIAEDRRKHLEEILERTADHERRAKHLDLVAHRRRD